VRFAGRWDPGATLVAGIAGGVILASTLSANATTTTPSPSATNATGGGTGQSAPQHPTGEQSTSRRSDEKLLTGDTADKVKAAALATYPHATIQRVETDSDGVDEAHLVTAAGDWVIVQVGKDFIVTGTQQHDQGSPGTGPRDHDGPGNDLDPNDNDGSGTNHPGGSQPGSSSSTATPSTTA
jgi:hypothetical protein